MSERASKNVRPPIEAVRPENDDRKVCRAITTSEGARGCPEHLEQRHSGLLGQQGVTLGMVNKGRHTFVCIAVGVQWPRLPLDN